MENSMTDELKTLVFDDMENLELTENGASKVTDGSGSWTGRGTSR